MGGPFDEACVLALAQAAYESGGWATARQPPTRPAKPRSPTEGPARTLRNV